MIKKIALIALLLAVLLPLSVSAGERTLSINGNDQNAVWFISGEPSMVLNGFDLAAAGVALPAVIDRVSIGVQTPVPGSSIDVVIYQDANGGSPADAAVAGRTTVDITQAGTFTAVFDPAVNITQPVVWVGFYLPVNFEFLADTSGSSVLTYWAWTAGGRFDVNNLGSAGVLGPADGSAPVNINMNGKARITLEITSGTTPAPAANVTPAANSSTITQTVGGSAANINYMVAYPDCSAALYDTGDEVISFRDYINPHCREVPSWQAPANPRHYVRRGTLYDILFFTPYSSVMTERLNIAVTHCIRPAAEDLNTALVGVAFGMPRQWRILPTERYNDLVCAEVFYGGNLSYFVPSP